MESNAQQLQGGYKNGIVYKNVTAREKLTEKISINYLYTKQSTLLKYFKLSIIIVSAISQQI